MSNDLLRKNPTLQFARVLSEIVYAAEQEMIEDMALSMDCDPKDVESIMEQGEFAFDRIKRAYLPPESDSPNEVCVIPSLGKITSQRTTEGVKVMYIWEAGETLTIELGSNGSVAVHSSFQDLDDPDISDEVEKKFKTMLDGMEIFICNMITNGAVNIAEPEFMRSIDNMIEGMVANLL